MQPPTQNTATRRPAGELSQATTSSICGVGPSSVPNEVTAALPPTSGSVSRDSKPDSKSTATDVWYFLWAVNSNERPEKIPENQPRLMHKPDTKYVACRLCGDDAENSRWKVWKLGDGMTSCYRTHLADKHGAEWREICRVMHLKIAEGIEGRQDFKRPPFTLEMFYHLLVKWIAADDQSFNVIDCSEFRELLLYLGDGKLTDASIPHRTKVTRMVLDEFQKKYKAIEDDLKKALGRISYTTDLWSDPNRDSYMAVTAHYMAKDARGYLAFRSQLIAFRYIESSHSGANLANALLSIIDGFGIAHKLGQITTDNASNNHTLLKHMADELKKRGIPFDSDGNRIRCFPHVVNLAVSAILDELKKNPSVPILSMSTDPAVRPILEAYANVLKNDPIGHCREIVAACRVSGQRRRRLRATIQEGNESGFWKGKLPEGVVTLPVVQLLRDCVTRWSSTFKMISRVILLSPAIQSFLQERQNVDIAHLNLDPKMMAVLQDIQQVIEIPHTAQELLSFEHTPTLSMALPAYEQLIFKWKELQSTIWELSHYIGVGIEKLEKYRDEGRKTRVYAFAMILNPGSKFKWIRSHWSVSDAHQAQEWIIEAMVSYRTAIRKGQVSSYTNDFQPRQSQPPGHANHTITALSNTTTSVASEALYKGYGRMSNLNVSVRRSRSASFGVSESTPSPAPPTPILPPVSLPSTEETLSAEERAQLEEHELEEDRRDADRELQRYEQAGLSVDASERTTDLVRFWEQKEHVYPLLFHVAMDVLPAQASSVPSEHVFSSSKLTCTERRNKLSPGLLEALQILKFSFKRERLNFTPDLVADEKDYTISGPVTERAVTELVEAKAYAELGELFANEEGDD